jgi:hypothetical protein
LWDAGYQLWGLRRVGNLAEDAALGRIGGEGEKVRRYGEFRYAATSWKVERRVKAHGAHLPTLAFAHGRKPKARTAQACRKAAAPESS